MSAKEIMQNMLPVWVCHGVNFSATVPLNEFNAQFTNEEQALEAATQVIRALKGKNDKIDIVIEDGAEKAELAPVILCHLIDANPQVDSIAVFSHVVFANDGFYKESAAMKVELDKQMAEMMPEEAPKKRGRKKGSKNSKKDNNQT